MAGSRKTRWLDEREAAAWRGLQLMQLRLQGRLAHQLVEASGLSFQDYLVLVVLTEESCGRIRQNELARLVGWEQSRLSHHVSRMAARGLVSREHCPSDRRGAFVVVTEAGRREIEAAAPGHVEAVRRLFVDRLRPDQLEAIRDVAAVVLAGLDEECGADGDAGRGVSADSPARDGRRR